MHQSLYLIPEWFLNFSVIMEVLFSLATLGIAVAGFLVYRIIKDKKTLRFSIGFFMIAIAYASWALLNSNIASKISNGVFAMSLLNPPITHILGVYTYIVFFLVGLSTLAFTTLKTEKGGFYYLLIGLSLVSVVSSCSMLITFRLVSLFLLTFISFYYLTEWHSNQNKKACWTLYAFILLVVSNIFYIFTSSTTPYVIGHFMELGAYAMLLIPLVRMLRKR